MMSHVMLECFHVILELFLYLMAKSKQPSDALQTPSGGYITLEAYENNGLNTYLG